MRTPTKLGSNILQGPPHLVPRPMQTSAACADARESSWPRLPRSTARFQATQQSSRDVDLSIVEAPSPIANENSLRNRARGHRYTSRTPVHPEVMMGRPGISIDAVAAAVERLHRQGRAASPTNVRLEMAHGSYSTLTAHLRALGVQESKRRNALATRHVAQSD